MDTAHRSWLSLCQLRHYCVTGCNEGAAFAEALKLAERVPVEDMRLARRWLEIVGEYISILPGRLPTWFVPAAA
jgi:hypothetical protein